MPSVKLIRRWGQHHPGATVTVDQVQARWLIAHAIGSIDGVQAPEQEAFMPGADGSDPLASGDGTRRGAPVTLKGERGDNGAAPLDGSPSAGLPADAEPDAAPTSKVSGTGRRRRPAAKA